MGTQNKRLKPAGNLESFRFSRQQQIDSSKNIENRRKLGQFSTPFTLAKEIAQFGISLFSDEKINFLEPAFGTGVFYSALSEMVDDIQHFSASGFEIDRDYYNVATETWKNNNIEIFNADFLNSEVPSEKYNFVLTNPPYVRHQLIPKEQKSFLKKLVKKEQGIDISGLAGLYCYFLLLADKWLEDGAVCGWLLPCEFMDVNYGVALKEYLLNKVHLLRIHRYDSEDSQFNDALVSSCVVWFKKETVFKDYDISFSYGGTHKKPSKFTVLKKSQVGQIKKWTHITDDNTVKQTSNPNNVPVIGDYFDIKRGIATGDNKFFILNREQISRFNLDMNFFQPILPSPRNMKQNEIMADENGNPEIEEPLYLLNCNLSEETIKKNYPDLWNYLQKGTETTAQKYLCKNRKRWYSQEQRTPTAFLCSYMGRGTEESMPFRFILNHSKAIASNSYLLLYPKENLKELLHNEQDYQRVWGALQAITTHDIESEGRIYGGGLKKIEPKELAKVKCMNLQATLT